MFVEVNQVQESMIQTDSVDIQADVVLAIMNATECI